MTYNLTNESSKRHSYQDDRVYNTGPNSWGWIPYKDRRDARDEGNRVEVDCHDKGRLLVANEPNWEEDRSIKQGRQESEQRALFRPEVKELVGVR